MSQAKAVRDASRFAGKEDTVPLRLLYSMHNHSQITHDVISTRTRASSSPTQVAYTVLVLFIMVAMELRYVQSDKCLWYALLLDTSRYSHVVYVFVESSPFYAFHREFGKITFSPITS